MAPPQPPAALAAPTDDVRPIAVVTRRDARGDRDLVESWHHGILAVAAPDGEVHAWGDVAVPVYVRSTVKPFQAQACLELLEEHAPGVAAMLTPEELAVAWASHRGEPAQQEAVAAILARAGVAPTALTCPPSSPRDAPGDPPSRIASDCSGKHALFALAGRSLPEPVTGPAVLAPDGPVQRPVMALLEDVLGEVAAVAVDGCGSPAVAAPLAGLARAYRRLVAEPRWSRLVGAGLAHGGLVGGRGRVETALLERGVVAKVGAEGVYGAALRDADGGAWGIAVKAADGAPRASAVALVATAAALGAVDADAWVPPPALGGGVPVGTTRVSASLGAWLADLGGPAATPA